MQTISPAQHRLVSDIDAVIRARLAPHASQIIDEALNSTAVALPRGTVAAIVIAMAQLTTTPSASAPHAAAALELIRAGASMHRRLFAARTDVHAQTSMLHGPTLMLGDYFYALAASEMAEAPQAPIIADFSTCVMELSEAFLTSLPHDVDISIARSLQHIDDVEGAIVLRAIRAGMVCAALPADHIDVDGLAQAIGRVHALTIQLREAAQQPLHSFLRGQLILPLAYALTRHADAVQPLIDAHDEAALSTLLHQHDIIAACIATRDDAQQRAAEIIDTLPPSASRSWLYAIARAPHLPETVVQSHDVAS